jgi:hypothetical protein
LAQAAATGSQHHGKGAPNTLASARHRRKPIVRSGPRSQAIIFHAHHHMLTMSTYELKIIDGVNLTKFPCKKTIQVNRAGGHNGKTKPCQDHRNF